MITFSVLFDLVSSELDLSYQLTVRGDEYKTPVGSDWTLDDIVAAAPDAVSESGGYYIVHKNLTVDYGAKLTIEAGSRLKFDRSTSITVRGELVARGTATERIICRSGKETPKARDWNGIMFEYRSENNDRSILEYVDIEHANTGVTCRTAAPTISNVKITGCQNGIYGDSESSPGVYHSEIIDNNFWGIRLSGSSSEISNCTISRNYYGIYSTGSALALNDNTMENNTLYGSLLIDDMSVLRRNTVQWNGQSFSGLYPGIKCEDSTITLVDNVIERNTHAGIEVVNSTVHSTGDSYSGNLLGINLTAGSKMVAREIDVYASTEHGIKIVNASIDLRDSNVNFNGWGDGGQFGLFTGIYIDKGYGYLEGNFINENGFMGIALENSYAVIERDSILSNNMDGIYCWDSSPVIKNTSIAFTGRYDVFVDKNSNPYALNFFGNRSNINVIDESSSITIGFTYHTVITDKKGEPVKDAVYDIYDRSGSMGENGIYFRSIASDELGETPHLPIYHEIIYHDHTVQYYNFSTVTPDSIDWRMTVRAVKSGYTGIEFPLERGYGGFDGGLRLDKNPEIRLTTPDSVYSGMIKGILTLEGTASDEDGEVESIRYKLDNDVWYDAELTAPSNGSSGEYQFKIEWNSVSTTTGQHEMTIIANDGTGNSIPIVLELDVDNPLGATDDDGDGLIYADEIRFGTDPALADTDSDGLADGIELDDSDDNITNPLESDTDGDGLPDGSEDKNANGRVEPTETDPNNPDTDGDTIRDSEDDYPLDSTRWEAEENGEMDIYLNFAVLMVFVIVVTAVISVFVYMKTEKLKIQNERKETEEKKTRKRLV